MNRHKRFTFIILFIVLPLFIFGQGWNSVHMMHMPRGGAAAVKWENYIYVFGGKTKNNRVLDSVERFNLSTGLWDKKTVPNFEKARYDAAAVVFENKIYLMGGKDETKVFEDVQVYDPVQNTWSEAHDLHKEREGFAAVILDDHIYVIGGRKEQSSLIRDIEWYNQNDDKWEEANWEMNNRRADLFSAAYNDSFYMFGGYYYGLTKTSYVAVPTQWGHSWQNGPELSIGRMYGASVCIDDRIYMLGGETTGGKSSLVEMFDVSDNEITTQTGLNSPRSGMASVAVGDTIYIIGGFEGNNDSPVSKVEYNVYKLTSIETEQDGLIPSTRLLVSGYPNPFNGSVSLQVQIPRSGHYKMEIFDISGKLVETVFDNSISAGHHRFIWNAANNNLNLISTGVYFFVVRSSQEIQKFKLVYVK